MKAEQGERIGASLEVARREPLRKAAPVVRVRRFGITDYEPVWTSMRAFARDRDRRQQQIWLLEHRPVFTLGQAGRPEHVITPGAIPVVRSDRGGQVTYHGPGQLVAYLILDLRRLGIGARRFVERLEEAVIKMLAREQVIAVRRPGAPGVYVDGSKVAALGLRVSDGWSYHGLALNVSVDLEPFRRIHPCGFPDLEVTRLQDLGLNWSVRRAGSLLVNEIANTMEIIPEWIDDGEPRRGGNVP